MPTENQGDTATSASVDPADQPAVQSGPQGIDIITNQGGNIQASGDVAIRLLQGGMNPLVLRTNDVLRKEEWLQLDNILIEEAQRTLRITADMRAAGMIETIQNGLGTMIYQWERAGSMDNESRVSMSGIHEAPTATIDFDLQALPLPIVHNEFNINIRKLEASRRRGEPLDMTQGRQSARRLMETIEDILLFGTTANGALPREGNARIFGMLNFNKRWVMTADAVQGTAATFVAAGRPDGATSSGKVHDWSAAAGTNFDPADFVWDVITMMQVLQRGQTGKRDQINRNFGPYVLYCSQAAYLNLLQDYSTTADAGSRTILDRLLMIPDLQAIRPIRPTALSGDTQLDDKTLIMLQMTPDIMDIVVGMQPTTVQWTTNGGMTFNFKNMAIMVPRPKATIADQCGILVAK